jgi:hypothetical protein
MAETGIVKKLYKWKHSQEDQQEGRWEDDVRSELKR